MFRKLDADGSNAISMKEMQNLFNENGLQMSTEEIANAFSVVKQINDAEWLSKANTAKQQSGFITKKPYVQSLADMLKLQLSRDDFKMVTEKSIALKCK